MDTNSFTVHVKAEELYIEIAKSLDTRFDTSNYNVQKFLRIGKNKNIIGNKPAE